MSPARESEMRRDTRCGKLHHLRRDGTHNVNSTAEQGSVRQLTLSGDYTSLRFYFAKIVVNECNRDFSPTEAGLVPSCPAIGPKTEVAAQFEISISVERSLPPTTRDVRT